MYRTRLYKQKLQSSSCDCDLNMTMHKIPHTFNGGLHIPCGFMYLVEYCCPKFIWNENTILWCGGEPGTYSTLNLNYGMISRVTASCFVALQSSSCLSRIQPLHPKWIPNSSQQLLLPTLLKEQPLTLASWIPNIQPKLHTAVSFVNLLASHPQKLTKSEFEALVC